MNNRKNFWRDSASLSALALSLTAPWLTAYGETYRYVQIRGTIYRVADVEMPPTPLTGTSGGPGGFQPVSYRQPPSLTAPPPAGPRMLDDGSGQLWAYQSTNPQGEFLAWCPRENISTTNPCNPIKLYDSAPNAGLPYSDTMGPNHPDLKRMQFFVARYYGINKAQVAQLAQQGQYGFPLAAQTEAVTQARVTPPVGYIYPNYPSDPLSPASPPPAPSTDVRPGEPSVAAIPRLGEATRRLPAAGDPTPLTGKKCALVVAGENDTAQMSAATAYGLKQKGYAVTFVSAWKPPAAGTVPPLAYVKTTLGSDGEVVEAAEAANKLEIKRAGGPATPVDPLETWLGAKLNSFSTCSKVEIAVFAKGQSCSTLGARTEDHQIQLATGTGVPAFKSIQIASWAAKPENAGKPITVVMPTCDKQKAELAKQPSVCGIVFSKGDNQDTFCRSPITGAAAAQPPELTTADALSLRYFGEYLTTKITSEGDTEIRRNGIATDTRDIALKGTPDCLKALVDKRDAAFNPDPKTTGWLAACRKVLAGNPMKVSEACNFDTSAAAFHLGSLTDRSFTPVSITLPAPAGAPGALHNLRETEFVAGDHYAGVGTVISKIGTGTDSKKESLRPLQMDLSKIRIDFDITRDPLKEPFDALDAAATAYRAAIKDTLTTDVPTEQARELASTLAQAYRRFLSSVAISSPERTERVNPPSACRNNKL